MTTDPTARAEMPDLRRLIVCFDGTWNTPEDETNVSRIYAAIADQHANCTSQLKFYDPGVGTAFGSRVRGGAFGTGLNDNILQGYCWLINQWPDVCPETTDVNNEKFHEGPDIFVFGFSRGAYTARSLAGLINRCGLLKRSVCLNGKEPLACIDSQLVQQAWMLYRKQFDRNVEARLDPECIKFRNDNAWTVKITFLGVWDTVGALGVPMFSNSVLARVNYGFHDTSLGRVVENAFHAIAIDEQREDYKVTLWERAHKIGTKRVEQRWFPGAHANVGGGYEDDLLPDPPLKWMAERALEYKLEFNDDFKMSLGQAGCKEALPETFKLRGNEYLSPVRDSYKEFMYGVYRLGRALVFKGRYYRPMLTSGVNETIDETAHLKWANDPRYRPRNFAFAGRSDIEPGVTV